MLKTMTGYRWRVCMALVVLFVTSVHAVGGNEDRGRDRREKPEDSRKEQLRQEAQGSVSEVEGLLAKILETVNQNQKPEADLIAQAAVLLEENKRFVLVYEDDQKAQYMLLRAWTDFYQGHLPDAMNWSLRACKMDGSSRDAWISQAVFCQLSGKRPLEPRIRKPNPRRERDNDGNRQPRRRRENEVSNHAGYASASEPYGRKGTLNFDLSALRKEMLKERFARVEYRDLAGEKIEYKPGEDTLCIFFWQVEPAVADANDLSGGQEIGRTADVNGMMNDNGGHFNNSQNLSLDNQRRYLDSIYEVIQSHSEITCFALNTNDLQDAKKAIAEIDENFVSENRAPMIFAAEPTSGAAAYAGLDAQVPFMLIADKEGIVRYAGPAADFMPTLVLSHLTGVEFGLDEAGRKAGSIVGDREYIEEVRPRLRRAVPQSDPNHLVPDPNRPTTDPNSVPVAVQTIKKKITEPVEMTLEDEVNADHLLALAQTEIGACRTFRGKSPVKGVDACKEVLEKYPGTTRAEQAREQLRRVPQRYWEKYGIADLLGY